MSRRVSPLESIAAHALLVPAVAFALYPVLWVLSLAFSGSRAPAARVFPVPHDLTTAHLDVVVSTTKKVGHSTTWLFGMPFANSIAVALATALVGVAIAIPA